MRKKTIHEILLILLKAYIIRTTLNTLLLKLIYENTHTKNNNKQTNKKQLYIQ